MRVHAHKSLPLTLALAAGALLFPPAVQAKPHAKEPARTSSPRTPAKPAVKATPTARPASRAAKPAARTEHPSRPQPHKPAAPVVNPDLFLAKAAPMPRPTPAEPLVVHDRKRHYSAVAVAAAAAASAPTPRKATTADFLAPLSSPAPQPVAVSKTPANPRSISGQAIRRPPCRRGCPKARAHRTCGRANPLHPQRPPHSAATAQGFA